MIRSGRDQAFFAQLRNLNAGLLGLGVSLATTTIALNIKNLAGRPRPDFLERCQPDMENIAAYAVGGGYGRSVSELWVMVTRGICQADWRKVNEGFRSFPSGYAMGECLPANIGVLSANFNTARVVAFAGLWYLTLFMNAKSRIIEPYKDSVSGGPADRDDHRLSNNTEDASVLDEFLQPRSSQTTSKDVSAAPPTYFLILPYLSFGLAIFIAGTRYFDFRNHGSDVFAGAAGGTASGSFAFWVYGRRAFSTYHGRET